MPTCEIVKSQFIALLERMISVLCRTDDIPFGYDIRFADDIRYAYVGVATPRIENHGLPPIVIELQITV